MFVGTPRLPSCRPTETPITVCAPMLRAASVGTGATRPPSARHRVPISTGSNKPGNAQLARMASARFPCVNTTGSPEDKSVATTATGMRRSSNWREPKTRSTSSPRRWLLARPKRDTRQRAISRKRNLRQASMIRSSGAPLAYAAPRMLPTLLPAMCETLIWCCRRTFRTPRCANPRAKPPPRASPIPARRDGVPVPRGNFCSAESWRSVIPKRCQRQAFRAMVRPSSSNGTKVLRDPSFLGRRAGGRQYELTSPVPSLYHCEPQPSARFSSRHAEVLWGRKNGKRVQGLDWAPGCSSAGIGRHQSAAARKAAERRQRHGAHAHRGRLGRRHLQDHDPGSGRRRHGPSVFVRSADMKTQELKYVTRRRAAVLLGLSEQELSRLSRECGFGRTEVSGQEEETFFTYEELRQICLLTVNHVH